MAVFHRDPVGEKAVEYDSVDVGPDIRRYCVVDLTPGKTYFCRSDNPKRRPWTRGATVRRAVPDLVLPETRQAHGGSRGGALPRCGLR
jgi:hypothetical protein